MLQFIAADDAQYLHQLLAVSRQTFYDAFEKPSDPDNFKRYVAKAFLPEVLLAEMNDPMNAFFLVKIAATNETCGYIKLRWDRGENLFGDTAPETLEIQRIYLLQAFWRKGLGKTMLRFCEDFARKMGKNCVWLVVWEKNDDGVRFYEREGYEKFDRVNFPFGDEIHFDFAMRRYL
jgi:diamine N-acetyltransferase